MYKIIDILEFIKEYNIFKDGINRDIDGYNMKKMYFWIAMDQKNNKLSYIISKGIEVSQAIIYNEQFNYYSFALRNLLIGLIRKTIYYKKGN